MASLKKFTYKTIRGLFDQDLDPGDAVIYNACKIAHWRETYEGDYHMQVFFHYVNKKGRYTNLKGDRNI